MPVIESQLDTLSEDYAKNREAMQKVVDEFRSVENKVIEKSESQRPKFEKRGKMLPHDRLARLLDAGSPFLSLMSLAGYMRHDDKDGTEAGANEKDLKRWIKAFGWENVVNRRGTSWKKLPQAERDSMTASTAVQTALNNPSLIKRPIIEGDGILELGFDPARWAEVFKL